VGRSYASRQIIHRLIFLLIYSRDAEPEVSCTSITSEPGSKQHNIAPLLCNYELDNSHGTFVIFKLDK
jgi:hypothetical protein